MIVELACELLGVNTTVLSGANGGRTFLGIVPEPYNFYICLVQGQHPTLAIVDVPMLRIVGE